MALYEHCTEVLIVCKLLIIRKILVEAAGVKLITMLIARKLLILGTATTAKKAPSPNPLYVYYTKTPSALELYRHRSHLSIPHSSPWIEKRVQLPVR